MLIFAGFQRDSVFSQGLRMAVGQIGIVPFDAERLKRLYVIRERLRRYRAGDVDLVDVLDGKHD
jgi:hypothetical protein